MSPLIFPADEPTQSLPIPSLISPKILGSAGVKLELELSSIARLCINVKPSIFCDASMATRVKLILSLPVGSDVVPTAPIVPVFVTLDRLPDWSLIA